MELITIQELVSTGIHFGHRTKRWNPKMAKFIYGKKNGVHIIDLRQTQECLKRAYETTVRIAEQGKGILYVGTKKQAKDVIKEEAIRSGAFYITERWLGGLLTNFNQLYTRVQRLRELEQMREDGRWSILPKKELVRYEREFTKLSKYFEGIKEMDRLPGLLFIVDVIKEATAVKEANKMEIPVIAIVDTNADPTGINYPIPGNDDSLRAISLVTRLISNAILEGRKGFETEEKEA